MNVTKNKKIELLAPVGNFEKLEIAIHYGADAIYLGSKDFSLRNFSGNFTIDEMKRAVTLAHSHDVKVYVACNIYSRNEELDRVETYLKTLGEIGPDAVIVADPGIFASARKLIPHIDIHLSTQSNTTNANTAIFWKELGATRVNVARELPLSDIRQIVETSGIEVEAFIHGAMCISYSGRCLLSSFMTDRDSNRGQCSHPCRWQYSVVERFRPDEDFPLYEDNRGSYVFNSKDLCMIENIPALVDAGIHSLKIEGRMKGINYLATVVKVYREAIDLYLEDPENYRTKPEWLEELTRINSREYCSGFFFGHPDETKPNYTDSRPGTVHRFVGKILEQEGECRMKVGVRNRIRKGDPIEVLCPKGPVFQDKVLEITDKKGELVDVAQPNTIVTLTLQRDYAPNDLIRNAEDTCYLSTHGTSRRPKSLDNK